MDRSFIDFYRLRDILRAMTVSRRHKPLDYKRFSGLLLSDKRDKVIDYVLKALVASFAEETDELELVFDSHESVASFFLNLCREYSWILVHELTHSDRQRRYQMCLILRSLFGLKYESPAINVCRELITEQMNHIWLNFLKLFTDSEPNIRIVCIEITEVLLRTQIDEHIVSNIVHNLKKRLRDLERVIREESAVVIEASGQSENILDRNLMRHFVARIGDTDHEVKARSLISVANVFNIIRNTYCQTHCYYFFKLSTACLLPYHYTELEEEKAWIEEIFVTNLIDRRAPLPTKMLNLLELICHCDPIGIRAISKIFHNQLIVRTLFAKLMVSSKRHAFELSIIYSNRKVAKSLKKLFEYIDNIKEVLLEFHLLLKQYYEEDNDKFKDLLDVFMSKTTVTNDRSDQLIEEFFSREQTVVDSQALAHIYSDLKARTGVGLLDVEALIQLLSQMDNFDAKFADRLVSFIVLLSKCYFDYFTSPKVFESVLTLPHIVLTHIASDSVIQCINWSQSLKDKVIDKANEVRSEPSIEDEPKDNSSDSESIVSSSAVVDFEQMQNCDPFQDNTVYPDYVNLYIAD